MFPPFLLSISKQIIYEITFYKNFRLFTFWWEQDPNKAKQVTLDFTTYLRKNFAAIASEETISFLEELEHTAHRLP